MREYAVIQAEELNVHSTPGGDSTKIDGVTVKRGDKYHIIDKRVGKECDWLKIVSGWIAAHNNNTGDVFVKIERVPDAPVPPVIEVPESFWELFKNGWYKLPDILKALI